MSNKHDSIKCLVSIIFILLLLPLFSGNASGGENAVDSEPAQEAQAPGNARVLENPFPAARVNGVAISRTELDKSMNSFIQQRGMDTAMISDPGRYRQVQLEVLDGLIVRELLWQEAKKRNFMAKDEEVAKAINEVKGRFDSEEDFTLRLSQSGYSLVEYKDFLRQQLSVRNLVEKDIATGIEVSDDEVHEYYEGNFEQFKAPEQVHARHILVKVDPSADDSARAEAKKKIDGILSEAQGGADFSDLARKHSEGPSGPKGGDLGFFSREQMVEPFAEAAFSLKPGEISGVVETVYGYHIIKMEEKRAPRTITEENVREQVREYLYTGKIQGAVQERVDALRSAGEVEILIGQ